MDSDHSNELRINGCNSCGAAFRVKPRRPWCDEEKLAIPEETPQPDAIMALVALRYGIGTGQIYSWRKQFLCGAMAGFVPVEVIRAEPAQEPTATGRVDIGARDGLTVSIDRAVDRTALKLAHEVIGELCL